MTFARCSITALLIQCFAAIGAADWPQFRGETGQGLSDATGLPASWSETENVAWKVPIDGLAWSSPVVVDGRIYLTTADPGNNEPEQSLRALCLNADTGDVIWEQELFRQQGKVEMHGKNSHASPTPIVEDGRVYVHFGPHGTACLTTDGKVVWKTEELKYGPRHGTGASPAIADDLLIIPCDGWDVQYVVGLEKATGKIRWKTPRDTNPTKGFSFATPLVIDAAGRRQAICPASDAVFAYEPATGKEIWRVRYGDGYSLIPRPLFSHGLVYVCTGYNTPILLAIDPSGRGDMTDSHVKWSTKFGVPHSASPLIVGDELYMVADRGVAVCLNAVTGEEYWHERVGEAFSASPLFADGKIYFQDEHGHATVIQPGTEFHELSRNAIADGKRTYASYAVADGALFVRSESHLYRIQSAGP